MQKNLNEFADWILSYVPPEIKKPINIRLEKLKKKVNVQQAQETKDTKERFRDEGLSNIL